MLAVTETAARRIWLARPNFSISGRAFAILYNSRRSSRPVLHTSRSLKSLTGFPAIAMFTTLSIFRFPFSIFQFPFSIFQFPVSSFRGQEHPKARPLARLARNPDPAAMVIHNLGDEGEPQSHPFFLGGEEGIEDLLTQLRGDAGPGILDVDLHTAPAVRVRGRNPYG